MWQVICGFFRFRMALGMAIILSFRYGKRMAERNVKEEWVWSRLVRRVKILSQIGASYDLLCAACLLDFQKEGLLNDDFVELVLGDKVWDYLFDHIHGYRRTPEDYDLAVADISAKISDLIFMSDRGYARKVLIDLGGKFDSLLGGNSELYTDTLSFWQREYFFFTGRPHITIVKKD